MHPDGVAPGHSGQRETLNESQRRHFEVFLELLEKSLDEVERLASLPAANSPDSLIAYQMDLPDNFEDRSGPIIQRLRQQAGALARALQIIPTPRSRRNAIRALLTAEVVRVDDSFSGKLRGYGNVSPKVSVEVDPRLASMRSDLRTLLGYLKAPAIDRPPDQPSVRSG